MWKCEQCGEEMEDQFDSCWKCAEQAQPAKKPPVTQARVAMKCLRCDTYLEFHGTKRFHEGTHWEAFWGDLFVNRELFEVYVCPECGHVEFFVEPGEISDRSE